MSHHYEVDDLVSYERGVLGPEEAEELFAHCQVCRECGTRLAMVLSLRRLGAKQRKSKLRRIVAISACIVAVLGLVAYAYRPSLDVAPATVTPEAEPQPGRLSAYATSILPRPGFLVLRFGDALPVAVDDWQFRLKAAAGSLWKGELETAVPALRELRIERPADPEVAAYLGTGLYLSGSVEPEVRTLLEEGTTTEWVVLSRYSMFYLANHYLRTGRDSIALALLENLKDIDAPGTAAAELLERIPRSSQRDRP